MVVRTLALLIFCAACSSTAAGRTLEQAVSHFDAGNRLAREGEYPGALEQYGSALESGYVSGALYYNMGNAYYRLDELGQAIRYYEKAAVYLPNSPELNHNLRIARERTVDSFSRLPEPPWRPAWTSLVDVLTPFGIYGVGLFFYLAATAAYAMRIRRGRSPWIRRTMFVGGIVGMAFLLLGFAASIESVSTRRAVVLQEEVTLLDRPDGGGTDLVVHEGTVVDVVAERGAWSEVRLPNGTRGWMRASTYGTI